MNIDTSRVMLRFLPAKLEQVAGLAVERDADRLDQPIYVIHVVQDPDGDGETMLGSG